MKSVKTSQKTNMKCEIEIKALNKEDFEMTRSRKYTYGTISQYVGGKTKTLYAYIEVGDYVQIYENKQEVFKLIWNNKTPTQKQKFIDCYIELYKTLEDLQASIKNSDIEPEFILEDKTITLIF